MAKTCLASKLSLLPSQSASKYKTIQTIKTIKTIHPLSHLANTCTVHTCHQGIDEPEHQ